MANTKTDWQRAQEQEQEQTKQTLPVNSQLDDLEEVSDAELVSVVGGALHLAAGGSIGI